MTRPRAARLRLMTRGTRDYEDPGTPESPASTAGDTHQTQILLFLQCRSRGMLESEMTGE